MHFACKDTNYLTKCKRKSYKCFDYAELLFSCHENNFSWHENSFSRCENHLSSRGNAHLALLAIEVEAEATAITHDEIQWVVPFGSLNI